MAEFLSPSNQIVVHSQSQTAEDDDEDSKKTKFEQVVVGSGGASSSSRKPRGRPPGSKNKPKPPVVITKESESAMHPMFLEISPNTDILDAVFDFARRRGAGVSILSGSGPVSNVSLRHPTVHTSAIALSGRFEILSLAGTFLPNAGSSKSSPFMVSLAGVQGQVIGGMVAGPLMSAGTVVLTAASFLSPEFYRLPMSGEEEEQASKEEHQDVKVEIAYSRAGSSSTGQLAQEMVLWGSPAGGPPRAPPPHSHRPPPAHY